MKILVVTNPVAGGGKTVRLLPKIKRWLSVSPHEFSFVTPPTSEEMRTEIRRAVDQGIEGLLLVGGDGTVHQALRAIAETNLPFGFLPCGRGNDFARNIGIPSQLKKTCSLPSDPWLQKVDLPGVNGSPFISVAYTGFDAEVNKLANDGSGHFGGTLGYIVCVLKVLKAFRPFEAEITVDEITWRERVMMVTVANAPFYGGGMKIAPEAKMNDGLLNVCIVKEISKWELLWQFPKVFKGTHIYHPRIVIMSGRRIRIASDEPQKIFADGEHVGHLPAECTIGNQTIQIISSIKRVQNNEKIS